MPAIKFHCLTDQSTDHLQLWYKYCASHTFTHNLLPELELNKTTWELQLHELTSTVGCLTQNFWWEPAPVCACVCVRACHCTSLEWARAAWAAVLAGAGGGVRAAEGAILLSRAGRLLGAGRLIRERTATQQSGFLRGQSGQHSKSSQFKINVLHCNVALTPFRVV